MYTVLGLLKSEWRLSVETVGKFRVNGYEYKYIDQI